MGNLIAGQQGVPGPRSGGDGDVLRRTAHDVVRRVPDPDGTGTVIHQQALGPDGAGRTGRCRAALERLDTVYGVAHLLPGGDSDTLVLEDLPGRSLAEYRTGGASPPDQAWVCLLGLRLARVLAAVHGAGVVLGGLTPDTIVVGQDAEGRPDPVIGVVDSATIASGPSRPAFADPIATPERLPYLAPERTVRGGPVADPRTDLYALGACLYEVATGEPPFADDDPLRLLGLVVARTPAPAGTRSPAVPEMLSRIIARLLEKEPAARYQTASGLAHDLARAAEDPRAEFSLGLRDEAPGRAPAAQDHDRGGARRVLAVVRALTSETDPDRLQVVLVEQLRALTGADDVHLVAPDELGTWPAGPGAAERSPLALAEVSRAAGMPLLIADTTLDERLADDPYLAGRGPRSLLAVPVVDEEGVRAVLVLEHRPGQGLFTDGLLDVVKLVAAQLSIALVNASRYRLLQTQVASHSQALEEARVQLEQLTTADTLTGVGNRLRFDEEWPAQWERARVGEVSIAVLMIDVDELGPYNEALGRAAGDACLRAVAGALTASVRGSDTVCRYGADRFAIILPRAELRQAFRVAQRAHAAVRALALPHPGEFGSVTVSIGVAAHAPDDDHAAAQLVVAANAALCEAKHSGRDQVVAMAPGSLDGD